MPKSAGQNQVTLERPNKEQGCLSLSYLSEGPNIDDANFTPPSAKKKTTGNSKSVEQVCIQIKRLTGLFD